MIQDEYFEWLYNLACKRGYPEHSIYRKLLMRLHDIEFFYSISRDGNRAEDGMDLRWRFVCELDCRDLLDDLDGACTVLEMILALAIRCEETIMDDPQVGDRTRQWFWGMIANLGLIEMVDDQYDRDYVDMVVYRFLNREFEPDGQGSLFTVRDCRRDLRDVEIWVAMCWYLDSIS